MSNTFCALPFVHSCVRVGGTMSPCCRFDDSAYLIDGMNPREYFDSRHLEDIRKKMIVGEKLKGCTKCYQEEELGKKSMRQHANNEYKKFARMIYPNREVKFIEVSFDNLCNMACVSCTPIESSKWGEYLDELNYDNKLGSRYKQSPVSIIDIDYTDNDYTTTDKIKLLGGEPFLNVKNIEFLEKFQLEKLHFMMHTNCSLVPNKKWNELLEKIKLLTITLSIDGMGEVAEFSRYGVEWNQVERVLDWFIKFKEKKKYQNIKKGKGVYLSVHSVIHIFNIFDLNNFKNYLIDKQLRYNFDVLSNPHHLDIKILPKQIKEQLINTIDYAYIRNYLIKNIDYVDNDSLDRFFIYAERLQKRQHFNFVDTIVEDIKKCNG